MGRNKHPEVNYGFHPSCTIIPFVRTAAPPTPSSSSSSSSSPPLPMPLPLPPLPPSLLPPHLQATPMEKESDDQDERMVTAIQWYMNKMDPVEGNPELRRTLNHEKEQLLAKNNGWQAERKRQEAERKWSEEAEKKKRVELKRKRSGEDEEARKRQRELEDTMEMQRCWDELVEEGTVLTEEKREAQRILEEEQGILEEQQRLLEEQRILAEEQMNMELQRQDFELLFGSR